MEHNISQALEVLRSGGIILYPTDTVWGIGCDATDEKAVQRIYDLKKRHDKHSMIVLLDKADNVLRWVEKVPEIAWELWEVTDRPLTLILPGGRGLASNMLPDERTVGIRLVDNEFCRRLIHKLGRPLISTSANISGEPSPARFSEISPAIVAGVDFVVDPSMEESSATHKPSSIIKLGLGGQVEIVRA